MYMSDEFTRLHRMVFGPPPQAARELAALWQEIFGQPPPLKDEPELLSRILVQNLPPAPPYELGRRPGAASSPSAASPRRTDASGPGEAACDSREPAKRSGRRSKS